ncbi:UPF0374 protein [Paenibacillus dendritiformis]|uniref:DUF402 domain-containing protein n=1 Tax=Paenibacillus dendritiformis TaxID=130049 RepID=UPI00143CC0D1|nr:DUF402 domain-containing protein [Paenibacillus dendritiformis]NKI20286.1 DUF402 domain-containing protein [Paenibacillus dendritiformis]NRF99878.1 DUF402 domain-containing protein [Paenibacillus dendritiformis]GIO71766.1 UPF0374 protein [Paenibacillus dendritiformis]
MERYEKALVKSFKHDGHLHRMWLENWIVPSSLVHPEHAAEGMFVLINSQTPIREADGKQWNSKIPAVTFLIPKQWFNVVALIEDHGIRYYCNIASPPYRTDNIFTYIDYDLDVIQMPGGQVNVVDQDEYEQNRHVYHYPDLVERKITAGLDAVLERIGHRRPPFWDDEVRRYYDDWKQSVQPE